MSDELVGHLATKQASPRLYFECKPNGNTGLHVRVMAEGWNTPNVVLARDALEAHGREDNLKPVDPEETPFVEVSGDE